MKTFKSSGKKVASGPENTGTSDCGESVLDFQYMNIEMPKDPIWIDGMFLGPISYRNKEMNAKE